MKKANLILGIMLIILLALSTSLMAADQVVTNNTDTGAGSLRQAIIDVGNGETITFDLSSGSTTITINSELYISGKSMTIDGSNTAGSGTRATIQVPTPGTSTWRVFNIEAGGYIVNLKNMNIKGGDISTQVSKYGGGIRMSDGACNLDAITISNSKACCGGAIYNNSSLSITNSTFHNNTSTSKGGAIYNSDPAEITNCTIFDNVGGSYAGAIYSKDFLTITNCTIVSNSAADRGGIYMAAKSASYGIVYLKNTILANNSGGTTNKDYHQHRLGTTVSNGYNIVEFSNFAFNATGDITGDQANLNISSTLADNNTLNGTKTLALLADSVAINAGASGTNGAVTVPTTDQRGLCRSGTTDIGSYEYGGIQCPPIITTTAASSITATTAQSGGNVTSDGGSAVTARGVCWSTSANPTTADSHTTDGTGTGVFTSSMTGLLADTDYYVRAYATNTADTAYGSEVNFTTGNDGTDVPSDVQDAGPNNGDGNGDGITDSKQTTVASLPSATPSEGYLTVEITGCDQIKQVETCTYEFVGTSDPGYSYPFGLLGFEIPCPSATVRIYYHGAGSLGGFTYRKYGPTPADWGAPLWYTMPGATFGTEVIGDKTVPYAEFDLTESQLGDDTEGFPIIDQGGPAQQGGATSVPTLNEWGMIILSLLMAVSAFIVIQRRQQS